MHKTTLSCLVCVGGVKTTADKTRQFCLVSTQFPISNFSVILNTFETEELQIGHWVETTQNCLVHVSSVKTIGNKTRRFCLVRVGSVNKLLATASSHYMLYSKLVHKFHKTANPDTLSPILITDDSTSTRCKSYHLGEVERPDSARTCHSICHKTTCRRRCLNYGLNDCPREPSVS